MVIGSYTVADQCTYHKQSSQRHTLNLLSDKQMSLSYWCLLTPV